MVGTGVSAGESRCRDVEWDLRIWEICSMEKVGRFVVSVQLRQERMREASCCCNVIGWGSARSRMECRDASVDSVGAEAGR